MSRTISILSPELSGPDGDRPIVLVLEHIAAVWAEDFADGMSLDEGEAVVFVRLVNASAARMLVAKWNWVSNALLLIDQPGRARDRCVANANEVVETIRQAIETPAPPPPAEVVAADGFGPI